MQNNTAIEIKDCLEGLMELHSKSTLNALKLKSSNGEPQSIRLKFSYQNKNIYNLEMYTYLADHLNGSLKE